MVLKPETLYLIYEKMRFYKKLGYCCNLNAPKSFNEKIIWRKVYDRNPLFPIVSDKIGVRDFIKNQIGQQCAEEYLIPLLHVTENPEEIPFDSLPKEYVIKANHGSGWLIIIDKNHHPHRGEIISECTSWMSKTFRKEQLEWAYSRIKPMILVEKLLQDRDHIPEDFKFFMFHGKLKMIQVHHGRFFDHTMSYYDDQMKRMKNVARFKKEGPDIQRPEGFSEMVGLAEAISKPFDFIRVDMYNIQGKIFIGELTLYPTSGTHPYDRDFDYELGSYWTLPSL